MKITHKLISIPPYLSTTWNRIHSLQVKDNLLIFHLNDGKNVEIPNLDQETIKLIFNSHAAYLEQEAIAAPNPFASLMNKTFQTNKKTESDHLGFESSFQLGFGTLDELGNVLSHNPAQANTPAIPQEILQKIALIANIIAPTDLSLMPKPQVGCNCVHCQVSRAMLDGIESHSLETSAPEAETDEEVSEQDLSFQQWNIEETSPSLFTVTSRLDSSERYSVYLGHPIGCTCGNEGCEHIIAVLKS